MNFKTRLQNLLARIASEDSAKKIKAKTKEESILAEIGDLANPFVVTFSGTGASDNAACDKTLEEIDAAYNAGLEVEARYLESTDGPGENLRATTTTPLDIAPSFKYVRPAGSGESGWSRELNIFRASGIQAVPAAGVLTASALLICCYIDKTGLSIETYDLLSGSGNEEK